MIYVIPFTQRGADGRPAYYDDYYAVIGSKVMPYTDPSLEEGRDYVDLPHASKSAFTWDMNSSNDITTSIRNHSGYIRIMDTGIDDSFGNPFDWRDIIPTGSMTKPFTLWLHIHDEQGQPLDEYVLQYCGYLQPDNFQSEIAAYPAEREYPICCPLQALTIKDFTLPSAQSDYSVRFADVLYQVIFLSGFTPDYIYFPGTNCNDWLGTEVQNAHYIEYEKNGTGVAPLIEKVKYNCRDVLEEFCQLFGLCVTMEGNDWVFSDLKAGYTQYQRLTLGDLYNYSAGATYPTFSYQTLAQAFPVGILSSSKMEILNGYGRVKITSAVKDEKEVFQLTDADIIDDFTSDLNTWVGDGNIFYKSIGNDNPKYWLEPQGQVTRHYISADVYGTLMLVVPGEYKDDQGVQDYADVYEAVARDTVKFYMMLHFSDWGGKQHVPIPTYRDSGIPMIQIKTPLYHYTSDCFIEFKFKMQYIKKDQDDFAQFTNIADGSFVCMRVRNKSTGLYFDGARRLWVNDANSTLIIPTANGQQRGTFGIYYSISEKSEGFCIPAGGTWDNPVGGAGEYEIGILGFWDNGGAGFTQAMQQNVFLSGFELNIIHTRAQKQYKDDTDVEAATPYQSTDEKSIELPFGCSQYIRNSQDSLPRYTFPWNVSDAVVQKSPQQRLSETLTAWGSRPREILSLKWPRTAEFAIGPFYKYQLTDQMGVVKTYMLLGYKRDLEQGSITAKLIEIDI